ncbi:MAG: hypothetical protein KTR32_00235, partial [Granulosicoccus sp.]|nr:hypothetical protein [Granulosicoccus sp.]
SVPFAYDNLSLTGDDHLQDPAISRAGAACPDAPVGDGFLLDQLGDTFVLLTINCSSTQLINTHGIELRSVTVNSSTDPSGLLAARYLGTFSKAVYLIRPDQHIAARWLEINPSAIEHTLLKATAHYQADHNETTNLNGFDSYCCDDQQNTQSDQ